MIDDNLHIILPVVFLFMVIVVGGYVYMMLNVMRADPTDKKARKDQGFNTDIIPKKIAKEESSKTESDT